MKYLAFDLETSKITEDRIDLLQQRPLGIACCASLTSEGVLKTWDGWQDKMTPQQCRKFAEYLSEMSERGYTITTWNGTGFDFLILAEESGLWETCRKLAWNHVDGMFHFFCQEGVAVGLQSAARGLGLEGKSGSGRNAPAMWAAGKREEVLAYVSQDVRVTLNVIQEIQKKGRMDWIAKSGRLMTYRLPKKRLLTVREAMRLPEPDVDWMKKTCLGCRRRVSGMTVVCPNPKCGGRKFEGGPWPRSKFTGWLSV